MRLFRRFVGAYIGFYLTFSLIAVAIVVDVPKGDITTAVVFLIAAISSYIIGLLLFRTNPKSTATYTKATVFLSLGGFIPAAVGGIITIVAAAFWLNRSHKKENKAVAYENAVRLFDPYPKPGTVSKALQENPADPKAQMTLFNQYYRSLEPKRSATDEAVDIAHKAWRLALTVSRQDIAIGYTMFGTLFYKSAQIMEKENDLVYRTAARKWAFVYYNAALKEDPNCAIAIARKGKLLCDLGHGTEALQMVTRARKLAPKDNLVYAIFIKVNAVMDEEVWKKAAPELARSAIELGIIAVATGVVVLTSAMESTAMNALGDAMGKKSTQ